MNVAFDFGITNTDVAIDNDSKNHFFTFPTEKINKQFMILELIKELTK